MDKSHVKGDPDPFERRREEKEDLVRTIPFSEPRRRKPVQVIVDVAEQRVDQHVNINMGSQDSTRVQTVEENKIDVESLMLDGDEIRLVSRSEDHSDGFGEASDEFDLGGSGNQGAGNKEHRQYSAKTG